MIFKNKKKFMNEVMMPYLEVIPLIPYWGENHVTVHYPFHFSQLAWFHFSVFKMSSDSQSACYRVKSVTGHLDGCRDFPRLCIGMFVEWNGNTKCLKKKSWMLWFSFAFLT